jgi:hypothetical protein
VRKFGQQWYDAACEAEAQWNEAQRNSEGRTNNGTGR